MQNFPLTEYLRALSCLDFLVDCSTCTSRWLHYPAQIQFYIIVGPTHHLVDIFLDSVVVIGVHRVQVDGVVDVGPHVVLMLHMVVKPLYTCRQSSHVIQNVSHVTGHVTQ